MGATFCSRRHLCGHQRQTKTTGIMPPLLLDSPPLAVLIADDHDLFALGLAETLAAYPDLTVVGRAADGAEAVALASELHPDVVLMDVNMPRVDGIAATREVTETLEHTRPARLAPSPSCPKAASSTT